MHFFSTGIKELFSEGLRLIEERIGETLYYADERRIFWSAVAYVLGVFFERADDEAKQRFLRYARGNNLDAIGELYGCTRLEPSHAQVEIYFQKEITPDPVLVPEGTKITHDGGDTVWTTLDAVSMAGADADSNIITARCAKGGAEFNEIDKFDLVDVIPYVTDVRAIRGAEGGDDGEPYTAAGDDRFRNRIRLAPNSFSTAGSANAYRYHALTAHPDVIDAGVETGETPGTVVIYILVAGDYDHALEVRNAVSVYFDRTDIRPMGDDVFVQLAGGISYRVQFTFYHLPGQLAEATKTAERAAQDFMRDIEGRLGNDIDPDKLKANCLNPPAGYMPAVRVEVNRPYFAEVPRHSTATNEIDVGAYNVTFVEVAEE